MEKAPPPHPPPPPPQKKKKGKRYFNLCLKKLKSFNSRVDIIVVWVFACGIVTYIYLTMHNTL